MALAVPVLENRGVLRCLISFQNLSCQTRGVAYLQVWLIRRCLQYLAHLLSDNLARNAAFQYALPIPFDQTSGANFREISMDKWYSLVPVWKTIIVRLEFFNDF